MNRKRTQVAYKNRLRQDWPIVDSRRRAVMVLRDRHLSYRQIATELGISIMTVKRDVQHMTLVAAGAPL